jgi:SAM-dependent methyltransferase
MTNNVEKLKTQSLGTWTTTQEEEDRMFHGHFHHWRTMVDHLQEKNLRARDVLDFGCNQGGFLRMLYNNYPFATGLGVDIAEESLAKARGFAGGLPIRYESASVLDNVKEAFDIAFSHEVIYLLQDLDAHAQLIRKVLRKGGVYYAATGCHTDNPLWPKWHKVITEYSNIPVPNYSLNDYAAAFTRNGFAVELQSFKNSGFIMTEPDDHVYYPTLMDKLTYYAQHKILFRCTPR